MPRGCTNAHLLNSLSDIFKTLLKGQKGSNKYNTFIIIPCPFPHPALLYPHISSMQREHYQRTVLHVLWL